MEGIASLLPLLGIALIFYLLVIRPASRRQKDLARMQGNLNVGDRVVLTSGFFGTVTALEDDALHLQLADSVTVKVARGAVGSHLPEIDESESESDPQVGTSDPEETD